MGPLRVVVDPNLLVSMLIGKRVARVFVIFKDPRFLVFSDQLLLTEFEQTATKTKFRKYFPAEAVLGIVDHLRKHGKVILSPKTIAPICRDPKDDYLLAVSKAAKANVLLTGGEDLLVLEKHGNTRIMNARTFVEEYLK